MTNLVTIDFSSEVLRQIDLGHLTPLVPEPYRYFFEGNPGFAPYRLLAYLSTQFNTQTLVEVGVHNGWGSLALSYNPSNRIVGFDIDLSTLDPLIKAYQPSRMTFHEGIAQEMAPDVLLSAPLIHLDTLHDGVYEQVFLDWLIAHRYRGVVVLDDIRLNDAMRAFWSRITLRKHDLTEVGHETGTGLVCLSH